MRPDWCPTWPRSASAISMPRRSSTARAGSMHGYDVIDPTRVNPGARRRGGSARLVAALRGAGLGLIVDIVPNHMAVGGIGQSLVGRCAAARPRQPLCDVLRYRLGVRTRPARQGAGAVPRRAVRRGAARRRDHAGARAAIGPVDPLFRQSCSRSARRITRRSRAAPPDAFDPATEAGRARLHRLLERQHYRLAWWRTRRR